MSDEDKDYLNVQAAGEWADEWLAMPARIRRNAAADLCMYASEQVHRYGKGARQRREVGDRAESAALNSYAEDVDAAKEAFALLASLLDGLANKAEAERVAGNGEGADW